MAQYRDHGGRMPTVLIFVKWQQNRVKRCDSVFTTGPLFRRAQRFHKTLLKQDLSKIWIIDVTADEGSEGVQIIDEGIHAPSVKRHMRLRKTATKPQIKFSV